MPGRNLYSTQYDLDGRRGKERDRETGEVKANPWHKFCKQYATTHNISYAAAVGAASADWKKHKEENGLKFRVRKSPTKKQEEEEMSVDRASPPMKKEGGKARNRKVNTTRGKGYGKRLSQAENEYSDDEYYEERDRYAPPPPKKRRRREEERNREYDVYDEDTRQPPRKRMRPIPHARSDQGRGCGTCRAPPSTMEDY